MHIHSAVVSHRRGNRNVENPERFGGVMTTTLLLALLLPLVAAVCWCAWVALKGLAHVVAALFVGRK